MEILNQTIRDETSEDSFRSSSSEYEDEISNSRIKSIISLGEKRFYAYILLETLATYEVHDKEAFLYLDHGLNDYELELALEYLEQIHYPTGNFSKRIH